MQETLRSCGFDPWVEKIPWRRGLQPTPLFLPGELIPWTEEPGGHSPWGQKESGTSENHRPKNTHRHLEWPLSYPHIPHWPEHVMEPHLSSKSGRIVQSYCVSRRTGNILWAVLTSATGWGANFMYTSGWNIKFWRSFLQSMCTYSNVDWIGES